MRVLLAEVMPSGGIAVWLRGGTYARTSTLFLGVKDSGADADHTIDWRAWPGEEVRISGGLSLSPSAFHPVSDAAALARLSPSVRSTVREADLAALGLTAFGEFPDVYRGAPEAPELFFNDTRMTLARWPNTGWATVVKVLAPGSDPSKGETENIGAIFEALEDRAAQWNLVDGVWLHGFWQADWYDETIRVSAYDAATRQITLAAASYYGVGDEAIAARRYYALNVLEELDVSGEYFIDRSRQKLYLLPPGEMAGARIVVSRLNGTLISLVGTSHLKIRDLIFENGLTNGVDVTQNGTGVSILGCTMRNLRRHGVFIEGGQGNRVERCEIHDVGVGGITIVGGDRKQLIPANHIAKNNRIRRFGVHQLSYAAGIKVGGVGNLVAHNLLYDAPHLAIEVMGNDHIIEYNEIHHVALETDDCGALYKGRDPSARGNQIRYNYWHHIGTPMGWGVASIYFDDGDGGDFVVGNVFYKAAYPNLHSFGAVFSHGGHGITAENNIFISTERALGSAIWNDALWAQTISGADWQKKLLQTVNITQPPYTTHYPELVGFMNPVAGVPRRSIDRRNLIVDCTIANKGNWDGDPAALGWVTTGDPGFVDAANGDFRLRSDSEVYTRIPGFQPIPFDQIGIQK
ncbi:MAG: right-handed parallel beta-helix repeat-containing protein [Verrucomicrobia bacterium]|nr:right-handed parallel beta-helix repeat-containing protein [Verrucomicrobiota bacterium]